MLVAALHATPGPGAFWLDWSSSPTAVFIVLLTGWLYARGLRSRPALRIHHHGTWRVVCYYGGLAAILVALTTPLDHVADELFVFHMIQHMLLFVVAAPLLLLGAPMIPLLRGIPRPWRKAVVIPVAKSLPVRGALRAATRPVVTWLALASTLFVWHVPAAYEAALHSGAAHALEHATMSLAGALFWWNIIDPFPLKANLSPLGRIPYVFLMGVPTFALGAFLTFASEAFYPSYEVTAPLYGMTALEDQQLGGVVMWIPGSFILMAAFVVTLFQVMKTEQRRQELRESTESSPAVPPAQ